MDTRKNLPRSALARIYFIDRKITGGSYPNRNSLAEEYETGTATIARDIEFMRDRLNAPIEYSALHRGYYYTEKTFRLPAAFTSADDLLALGLAKTLLSLYQNTPLYESARLLLDSITAPLTNGENTDWYEKRIAVPPAASYPVDVDIWNCIVSALKQNRVMTFEYQSTWTENFKPRCVRPYQLLFDNGVWYLYAYSEERSAIRMFSLSRIRNIRWITIIALTRTAVSSVYMPETGSTIFALRFTETMFSGPKNAAGLKIKKLRTARKA